jgi:DnaK suppressor protein
MEPERARQLLEDEKARLEQLLAERSEAAEQDRAAGDESARFSDGAESLTAEAGDDAVIGGIEARLGAIARAEERLAAGTYGRSVRSGAPIPDERLEADPAAELTVEEAAQAT